MAKLVEMSIPSGGLILMLLMNVSFSTSARSMILESYHPECNMKYQL